MYNLYYIATHAHIATTYIIIVCSQCLHLHSLQVDTVFPMLYVASYNELKQLHIVKQVFLNYHLATFL